MGHLKLALQKGHRPVRRLAYLSTNPHVISAMSA